MSLLSRAVAKLTGKLDAYWALPPYDYVQNIVSRHLASYLGRAAGDVKRICIVGTYLGNEVPYMLRRYPNADFTLFECSPRYLEKLRKRFGNNPRVTIIGKAASDQIGSLTFYETSLRGSGSVLPLGDLARASYGAEQREKVTVETTTLDTEFAHLSETGLDCLWIDVQGAEMLVLNGATELLNRADSVFIEVSRKPDLYQGGAVMGEITSFLLPYGLEPSAVGVDRLHHTGNAFYSKL